MKKIPQKRNQKLHCSPLRYPGGKTFLFPFFDSVMKDNELENITYVEPFAGGASIFFAKSKVDGNWLNDIDKDLINCLIIIRDCPDQLIEKLKG